MNSFDSIILKKISIVVEIFVKDFCPLYVPDLRSWPLILDILKNGPVILQNFILYAFKDYFIRNSYE